nr:relaxase/mobilization nuclease domain-containing protein [Empedobacter sp.]
MPIGEAHKTGNSFTGIFEYILAQGNYKNENITKKPEIVLQNFSLENDYKSLGKEFRFQANENKKVIKPVMHLTLNFSEKDNIKNHVQLNFLKRLLKEMGVDKQNHQYLVVRHNDKHPHYHIIVNRVGLDGITLSDKNSKLRIGTAVDKIEKELGLDNYLEKTRKFVYDPTNEKGYKKNDKYISNENLIKTNRDKQVGIKEKKDFIQLKVLDILSNYKINSLKSLRNELAVHKIEFKYTVDSRNQVAVSFKYDKLSVKGSQIKLKGNLIRDKLEANNVYNVKRSDRDIRADVLKDFSTSFKESINSIINQYNSNKIPNFKQVFASNGIEYNGKELFEYKKCAITVNNIEKFKNECDRQFNDAIKQFEIEKRKYNEIKNAEYKMPILGVLLPSQKKYNEELRNLKFHNDRPELKINIKADSFENLVINFLNEESKKIRNEELNRESVYKIDESVVKKMIDDRYIDKISSKSNDVMDSIMRSNSINDDYDEYKRKRKNTRKR